MAGLGDDFSVAKRRWARLFAENIGMRSAHAHRHWRCVEDFDLGALEREQWAWIPLREIFSSHFASPRGRQPEGCDLRSLGLRLPSHRLVFANGCLLRELLSDDLGSWTVDIDVTPPAWTSSGSSPPDVFLHLTESLSQESVHISLPAGREEHKPLYLLHLNLPHDCEADHLHATCYRHHVDIGRAARGVVVEHFVSLASPLERFYTGAHTTVRVGDDSEMSCTRLVEMYGSSYHFGHNEVLVEERAVVRDSSFFLGSGMTRQQNDIILRGRRSEVSANSLTMSSGRGIGHSQVYLTHRGEACLSRQLHRFIVRDRSRGRLGSLVRMLREASGGDGYVAGDGLVLGRSSGVRASPDLEIYNRDVRCGHSFVVRNISADHLFYLSTRGIDPPTARALIIRGSARELLTLLQINSLVGSISAVIDKSLGEVGADRQLSCGGD